MPELGEDPAVIVTKWFNNFAALQPAIDLYTFTAHRLDLASEEAFLNIVKACESFHRIVFNGHAMAPEKYMQRVDAILQSCPSRQKRWLERQLRFGNELDLTSRLRGMWGFVGAEITSFLPVESDYLIAATVGARNYLTHFSAASQAKAPNPSQLPSLGRWWLLILEASLLLHIGVARNSVIAMFKRGREFNSERFLELRNLEYRNC